MVQKKIGKYDVENLISYLHKIAIDRYVINLKESRKIIKKERRLMKANHIKDIIEIYDKSPYKCILIDGPWGVGKSYAIKEVLGNKDNACNISLFGLKDAQEIYHETFFQLAMKDKKGLKVFISRAKNAAATISNKLSVIKNVIESLVTEKELFLNITKNFTHYRFIVIDDLERMNENIKLKEVFGIIDELKKCNYIKVILVANTNEMSQRELFKKYSEKVIDRIYYITECPEKVNWTELNIHNGFITEFLSEHKVKNLRTLQKAQNFYEDVSLKLKDDLRDEFYEEIRLACYAIVVENIDNLYYKKPNNNQTNATLKMIEANSNKLESRIITNYLRGTRISNSMVHILQEYYQSQTELKLMK